MKQFVIVDVAGSSDPGAKPSKSKKSRYKKSKSKKCS